MIKPELLDLVVFKAVLIFFISGISNLVVQSFRSMVLKSVVANQKWLAETQKVGHVKVIVICQNNFFFQFKSLILNTHII